MGTLRTTTGEGPVPPKRATTSAAQLQVEERPLSIQGIVSGKAMFRHLEQRDMPKRFHSYIIHIYIYPFIAIVHAFQLLNHAFCRSRRICKASPEHRATCYAFAPGAKQIAVLGGWLPGGHVSPFSFAKTLRKLDL